MTNFYSPKIIEHFTHPKNMGEIKKPDGVGLAGNPICGDVMKITLKVGKKNNQEFIKEVKFKTLGCAAAIATSSMITEMAKGKTLKEALKINRAQVAKELGGLPPVKMHCSNLAAEALHKAIRDYQNKQSKTN